MSMRRIFLGLLAGAGAGWVAWSLRGWPPAYWKSAAAERTAETTWQRIGALLDRFSPAECANYLQNAGYASV